jgi:hypothetical protein
MGHGKCNGQIKKDILLQNLALSNWGKSLEKAEWWDKKPGLITLASFFGFLNIRCRSLTKRLLKISLPLKVPSIYGGSTKY